MELKSAPCIFQARDTLVICYVDDLLVFLKDESTIDRLQKRLSAKFVMKALGIPK